MFNNLLRRYENSTKSQEEITLIELEENSEFFYFSDFFEGLFSIKNNDHKIIKCYFEIKNCLYKLELGYEGYRIIDKCYGKFKNEISVIFEYLKQNILVF